jgi:ABC-type transport system substrate-binding protein
VERSRGFLEPKAVYQHIRVEAVEKHYRKTPEYKYLKFLYVPEHSTRVAMLKAGEADIAYLIGPSLPQVQSDPNLRIIWCKFVVGNALAFCDLAFPKDPSPFLDMRVRQAASLAPMLDLDASLALFTSRFDLSYDREQFVMGLDPDAPDFRARFEALVGAPKGIVCLHWYDAYLEGEANQVGPTPMEGRHDALCAAAEMILAVNKLPERMGGNLVATVGELQNYPNSRNIIPDRVRFTVDIRSWNDPFRNQAAEAIKRDFSQIGQKRGCPVQMEYRITTSSFFSAAIWFRIRTLSA